MIKNLHTPARTLHRILSLSLCVRVCVQLIDTKSPQHCHFFLTLVRKKYPAAFILYNFVNIPHPKERQDP